MGVIYLEVEFEVIILDEIMRENREEVFRFECLGVRGRFRKADREGRRKIRIVELWKFGYKEIEGIVLLRDSICIFSKIDCRLLIVCDYEVFCIYIVFNSF